MLMVCCRIFSCCQYHSLKLFSEISPQMQRGTTSPETSERATEELGNHTRCARTVSQSLGGLPGELATAPCSPGNAVLRARTLSWDLRQSQPWLTLSTSWLAVSSVVPVRISRILSDGCPDTLLTCRPCYTSAISSWWPPTRSGAETLKGLWSIWPPG